MSHDPLASVAPVARRSFLGRLGAAMAAASASFAAGASVPSLVDAQAPAPQRKQLKHPQDAWLDALPGAHRLLLDAVTPFGAVEAVMFGWNFLRTSGQPYGLTDADHAVVITMRHQATVMALPQGLWTKYKGLAEGVRFENPLAAGRAESSESVLRPGAPSSVPEAFRLDALAARGVHFAICGAAMGRLTQMAAGRGGDAAAVRAELEAALPANSHVMSSGITAAQRAQEYGYSYAHTG